MIVRQRFMFEAADTFGGEDATPAAAADDGAGASPTAADAPVPSGGDPPAPSWADTLEFREAVAAAADSRFQQALEQYGVSQAADPDDDGDAFDVPQLDPYSEDFGSQLATTLQQIVNQALEQKLQPIEQRFQQADQLAEQERLEAGNARIRDVLHDIQQRPDGLGEFALPDSEQEAIDRANSLFERFQRAYGFGPKAAELAIEEAYRQTRERENVLMEKGVERYKNQLATLSSAPAHPGTAAAGVQQAPGEFTSLADLGRQMDMRRRATGI